MWVEASSSGMASTRSLQTVRGFLGGLQGAAFPQGGGVSRRRLGQQGHIKYL